MQIFVTFFALILMTSTASADRSSPIRPVKFEQVLAFHEAGSVPSTETEMSTALQIGSHWVCQSYDRAEKLVRILQGSRKGDERILYVRPRQRKATKQFNFTYVPAQKTVRAVSGSGFGKRLKRMMSLRTFTYNNMMSKKGVQTTLDEFKKRENFYASRQLKFHKNNTVISMKTSVSKIEPMGQLSETQKYTDTVQVCRVL